MFKERREEEDSVQTFTFAIVLMGSGSGSLVWFRKGIRIHDNPALEFASRTASHLYPVFVIDPHYMKPDPNAFSPGSSRAGLNRIKFLLESLVDLDLNLKNLGSRLLILKGDPAEVVIHCLKEACVQYNTSVISTIDFFLSIVCKIQASCFVILFMIVASVECQQAVL